MREWPFFHFAPFFQTQKRCKQCLIGGDGDRPPPLRLALPPTHKVSLHIHRHCSETHAGTVSFSPPCLFRLTPNYHQPCSSPSPVFKSTPIHWVLARLALYYSSQLCCLHARPSSRTPPSIQSQLLFHTLWKLAVNSSP
jgi:hypothetical protein